MMYKLGAWIFAVFQFNFVSVTTWRWSSKQWKIGINKWAEIQTYKFLYFYCVLTYSYSCLLNLLRGILSQKSFCELISWKTVLFSLKPSSIKLKQMSKVNELRIILFLFNIQKMKAVLRNNITIIYEVSGR